ncbi:asparagine synthase (glutamine-hydrolyzing) [Aureibacillus halotolerans]|uniref:asparagine synthase (glutamine-hydrolyzing) n=1 Tax=Aureibacillus halotolerans TaxID=1508390 RepID=A0A4R6U0P3_9BACI|nr:asparagine synthase (glutamine-hydrolyzing) [Aureibacillus halotolerans]TDQ38792.1 asparagine synthase (glutamine-hydrolysing) [Aureibacillus halotolerans]
MCGFVGCICDTAQGQDNLFNDQFKQMTNVITHRGPDDAGFFQDEFVHFGFRRLSIIDVESGHQPLSYENERYWIIFNGEIYNYIELRNELEAEGYTFQTQSDTETIIALFAAKGKDAVKQLRGMFAFIIWDKQEGQAFGARDPFGIKPFFYMQNGDRFYAASEKKSLLMARDHGAVNVEALQHYLTFQFVPEPQTVTEGIHKLLPGYCFTKKPGESPVFEQYWQASFQPEQKNKRTVIDDIRKAMKDSVKVHMRSDVPVGSFLSGGIDSSAIVSIAKDYHPDILTFSVGFEHEGFSEVDVAKETADALGVENISYIITPEEYMNELPRIMWHMDDPLADPAAIPLYFVAREARKHVKVVLSGEGADELFGGYNIYREPQSLEFFQYVPAPVKRMLKRVAAILPEGMRGKSFLERGCTPLEERYIGNAKMFTENEKRDLLVHYQEGKTYQSVTKPFYDDIQTYNDVNRMQYIDIHTWLRGDILLKADKMTMAHSLELRVPFLDKEVFECARTIDPSLKIANGTTKAVLREAMRGIVPPHVLDRKKLGFPVPIRHWLKNEMYDWAKNLIQQSDTDRYFHKAVLLRLLDNHREGKADYSRKLWTVLMFMLWHQIYVEGAYSFEKEMLGNQQAMSI